MLVGNRVSVGSDPSCGADWIIALNLSRMVHSTDKGGLLLTHHMNPPFSVSAFARVTLLLSCAVVGTLLPIKRCSQTLYLSN